jgi:tRNA U34 5-carboxymethylaminomethyl modifying GTPase MnmE/TrmE
MTTPNIVVFGETGAGKSSVINMLEGGDLAEVSSSTRGVTRENTPYIKTINTQKFRVYDTAGLHEGSNGTVSQRSAIEALGTLIRELADGVHLLVFVMRAPRITVVAQQNYKVFFDAICDKKVPIVIVVTGLELEDDREGWWSEQKPNFDQQEMLFSGHACITATRGNRRRDGCAFEAEYKQSKKEVAQLIYNRYAATPWKLPEMSWFDAAVVKVLSIFGIESRDFNTKLYLQLKQCEVREAWEIASKMPKRRWTGWF